MKRLASILLAMVLILSISAPALAASSMIKKVEYEGNGKVDVDFSSKVQYKNAKVTVKDSSGKSYSVKITEKDSDDLEFKVSNIKAGKTYTFTISGIRKKGAKSYTKYSGKFTVPSESTTSTSPTTSTTPTSSMIKKVKYEGNGKVEVDFKSKVQYKNTKVTVKDSSGKSYSVKITDKDSDDIEFRVSNITEGATYTFTISGIRKKGASSYTSYTGTFTANRSYDHDDDDDDD